MIKIPGSVELQALRTVTPNVWGQGKMDVQLKQRVNLPFLWLFSSVSPSDGMTEWFPPALVCATFFTQIIKSVLISSFNNQLKLLVRSILPFLWLSLWVSEWTYNLLYWLFKLLLSNISESPLLPFCEISLAGTCLRKLKSVSDNMLHILIGMPPGFHSSDYHRVLISNQYSLMKTFCCCCFWLLMLFSWWFSNC